MALLTVATETLHLFAISFIETIGVCLNLSFAFLNRFRDYILNPFSQKSKRFFCRFMYFEHFSPIAQKSIVFM